MGVKKIILAGVKFYMKENLHLDKLQVVNCLAISLDRSAVCGFPISKSSSFSSCYASPQCAALLRSLLQGSGNPCFSVWLSCLCVKIKAQTSFGTKLGCMLPWKLENKVRKFL